MLHLQYEVDTEIQHSTFRKLWKFGFTCLFVVPFNSSVTKSGYYIIKL